MSSDAPAAIPANIVIAMLPPSSHDRLSAGNTAKNHTASSGIAAIGAANHATRRISAALRSRGRSVVLITMQPARAASVVETAVRNSRDGQKLALKKPAHVLPPSSQRPGVSCHDRMPLIQNRLIHDASAYSASKR